MATTGKISGTLVGLWLDGELVAEAISNNFSLNTDMIDVTNKDSGGFKDFLAGEHGGTFDVEGHFVTELGSTTLTVQDLLAAQLARTQFTAVLTTDVAGDKAIQADVLIASNSLSFPNNDAATFSCSLQITGTISIITES